MIRFFPAALALFLFTGCGTESEPGKTLAISPTMRSSCPEHPFKPEFQAAAKVAADARSAALPIHVEIYDNDGKLVNEWDTDYNPQSGSSTHLVWAWTDSSGKQIPSGYYFFKMTVMPAGSSQPETQTRCVFFVNDLDRDKMK